MADLVTHALSAIILRGTRPLDAALLWFVTGTIVPDLCARAPLVGLRWLQDHGLWAEKTIGSAWIYLGFNLPHTPVGIVLVAIFIAVTIPHWLAHPLSRRVLAGWIALGGCLHLGVDLLQTHLQAGYFLMYPFSVRGFEFGLVRSDGSALFLPVLIGISMLLIGPRLAKNRAASRKAERETANIPQITGPGDTPTGGLN